MIASVEGDRRARSAPIRWSSRSAASATASSAARARWRAAGRAVGSGCTRTTSCARISQALYGFRTTEELGFFELLITVTGVGPKVALAIVSSRPVADLQLAILQADEAVLVAVSGVGKKLAARIVLELKEKVAAAGTAAGMIGARTSGGGVGETEVVAALQALGYSPGEAREAARGAVAAGWRRGSRSRTASRRRSASCVGTEATPSLASVRTSVHIRARTC